MKKIKKLLITSNNAHFKIPYSSKLQLTYEVPPISTVLGILRVIYGEEIDNFIFGYTFNYEGKYNDLMNVYKLNASEDFKFFTTIDKSKDELTIIPSKDKITDVVNREYLFNCALKIYTNIDKDIKMNYPLTMGRANCLARLHFPIEEVKLINKEGEGYNQFTPMDVGVGQIMPITYYSKYDKELQSFQTKIKHLRYNKTFSYDKNYDTEEEHNILLWKYTGGEVEKFELC